MYVSPKVFRYSFISVSEIPSSTLLMSESVMESWMPFLFRMSVARLRMAALPSSPSRMDCHILSSPKEVI